jgi:plastocyanin
MRKTIITAAVLMVSLVWILQAAEAGEIKGRIKIKGSVNSSDVLVYIEGVDGVNGDAGKNLVVHQRDLTYYPRVSAVLAGSTVAFPNDDEVRHNVYSPSKGNSFNLGTYHSGQSKEVTFKNPGLVKVLCNVHDDMEAYIQVFSKAVWDVTDRRGRFSIKNVPAGDYEVKIWHPDHGAAVAKVEVPADGKVATLNMTLGE